MCRRNSGISSRRQKPVIAPPCQMRTRKFNRVPANRHQTTRCQGMGTSSMSRSGNARCVRVLRLGSELLGRYANGILGPLPSGSVYFGGTDAGRFVITMFHDITKSPDIIILTPKFVITQRPLIDWRYTEYLRLTQGDRLWLPSTNDIQHMFQEYASDMQERQQRGEQFNVDEQLDSSNHVRGVAAAMHINGIVTKRIFDHNKDKHPFLSKRAMSSRGCIRTWNRMG